MKSGATIAIIDDIPEILDVMDIILKRAGYETILYEAGEAFLNDERRSKIDLVLMDIIMPGIDGFEVCRQIKQDEDSSMPVIFVTGLIEVSNKRKAFELGASDYITKPVNRTELLARINTHLTIHQLRVELELSNSELEQKVAKRTGELKKANELLSENEKKLIKQNQAYADLNKQLSTTNAQLLVAKEKAEQNEKLKTAFLANMSHEIRTPMNGIIGFSSLLENDDIKENKRKIFLKTINNSCQQLLSIVDSILDISKIEADQMTVAKEELDLDLWMAEIYLQFESLAEEKKLKFIKVINKEGFSGVLKVDSQLLRQIINNLLSNAFKFTHKGSVKFGYTYQGDSILFYVADTGIGIGADNHDLIFERFSQGTSDVGRKYGGAGLGLTISQRLVKLLGGDMWLESTVDVGSTFYFTMPI